MVPRCREYNRLLAEERGPKDCPKVFSLQFTGSPLGRGAHGTSRTPFVFSLFFYSKISKCCTAYVILAHHEIYSYLTTTKLCTKVLELPQFCAAALGFKQCRVCFLSNRPHPFCFILFPQRIQSFILTSSRTLQELSTHVRVRALPAQSA